MASDKQIKMAVISGASHALNYKARNPHTPDEEIIQHINREMLKIVKKIDSGDFESGIDEI